MKKQLRKKVAKTILKEMKKYQNNIDEKSCVKQEVYRSPYNKESSESMRTFINKIVEQPGTSLDVRTDRMYINCRDVKQMMNIGKQSSYNDDRYLEIEIDNYGFSITYGHSGRNYFEDVKIFKEIMDELENVIIQKNQDFLNKTIENIYCESGLIRENNLDKLLD